MPTSTLRVGWSCGTIGCPASCFQTMGESARAHFHDEMTDVSRFNRATKSRKHRTDWTSALLKEGEEVSAHFKRYAAGEVESIGKAVAASAATVTPPMGDVAEDTTPQEFGHPRLRPLPRLRLLRCPSSGQQKSLARPPLHLRRLGMETRFESEILFLESPRCLPTCRTTSRGRGGRQDRQRLRCSSRRPGKKSASSM